MTAKFPVPQGHVPFFVEWNWNHWGAAVVATEAGVIPAISRHRGFVLSPYSLTMTMSRLREAWFNLERSGQEYPFPRRIYSSTSEKFLSLYCEA